MNSVQERLLLTEWNLEQGKVCLFRESSERLSYTLDDPSGRSYTFKSTLYDTNHAVSLISMFHSTIGINLVRENPHSACFLPKFCKEVYKEPGVYVALFGRVDAQTQMEANLKGLRWGVFYSGTKEEEFFDVDEDDLARTFILNAPGSNHPHLEPVKNEDGTPLLDEKGNSVMKPSSNHYAMNAFSQRFCVAFTRNSLTGCIQKVAMQFVSLIDKQILLSENKWAVTLVSSMRSTPDGFFSQLMSFFSEDVGHALLACEGVEGGKPFLRYVHFTQKPRDKNPELTQEEAQIECFEKEAPLNTFNGPTWTRSKLLVENMLRFAKENEKKRLKFAFYGSYFSYLYTTPWGLIIRNELLEGVNATSEIARYVANNPTTVETRPWSCLEMAQIIALYGGIFFLDSLSLKKPIKQIETLQSASVVSIPNDIDYPLLGRVPLPEKYREISERISSAYVILTPDDCRLDQHPIWGIQIIIELSFRKFAKDWQKREPERTERLNHLMKLLFTPQPPIDEIRAALVAEKLSPIQVWRLRSSGISIEDIAKKLKELPLSTLSSLPNLDEMFEE